MGFDWEDTLGDMDYEDAVDIAARALEKMQDDELEQEEQNDEADLENVEGVEDVTETQKAEEVAVTRQTFTGARFMDGCDDEPVFD